MKEIVIDGNALCHHCALQLAGAFCAVSTNSQVLADTLNAWPQSKVVAEANTFSMQVFVTRERSAHSFSPHFRGLHHLVMASFGSADVFVFDLLRRTVTATVSADLAEDRLFWNRVLLPIAMGVLGAAVGVVPVHCACLSVGGDGLLIAGASGAGKSTLSLALSQQGFPYISDDWTYLSLEFGKLRAHGMSVPIKLLPDAVDHFPALAGYPVRMALNNELAYEVPPQELGAEVQLSITPRWFMFLERTGTASPEFNPISTAKALQYIEQSVERLPVELSEVIQTRSAIIKHVSRLSCWKLTYSGHPDVAVKSLHEFMARHRQEVPA